MTGEPEAVSPEEQKRQTEAAHLRAGAERRDAWLAWRSRLEPLLDELRVSFGPRVANELRSMRREVDRLDSKLR